MFWRTLVTSLTGTPSVSKTVGSLVVVIVFVQGARTIESLVVVIAFLRGMVLVWEG